MGNLASESTLFSLARTFIIKNVGLAGLYFLLLLHNFFQISGENDNYNGWWKDTAWIQSQNGSRDESFR